MIYVTFIIPILFCLYLFCWERKATVWWEYSVVFLPSIAASFATEWAMERYNTEDTQYLGSYAVSVRHYDAWDEWIRRTCHRSVKSGKSTISIPYDCSYRQYHAERWVALLHDGTERDIDRETYESYRLQWKTNMQQIEMNRRYYRLDGDAQQYAWNNEWYNSLTFTEPASYENRVRASRTLYDLSEVDDRSISLYRLQNYPSLRYTDCFGLERADHLPVIGANVNDSIQRRFQFINGYYGAKYQFRVYVVMFANQPVGASIEQRNLMEGGNKNELVICIGTDTAGIRVNWINTFSWCDNPALEVRLKQSVSSQDSLSLMKLSYDIEQGLSDGLWHRKQFSDYSYIKISLSAIQNTWFFIIILLINIGIGLWVVSNRYRNK